MFFSNPPVGLERGGRTGAILVGCWDMGEVALGRGLCPPPSRSLLVMQRRRSRDPKGSVDDQTESVFGVRDGPITGPGPSRWVMSLLAGALA